jgi:DNA polymerase III alpha subunit (gram-positive type)
MGDIKKILFVDVETTGLDPDTDYLLEVACAVLDPSTGEVTERYENLVCIPPDIVRRAWEPKRFDGLDFQNGQDLHQICKALVPYLTDATIAGQNPAFDIGFLKKAFATCGIDWPKTDYHTIDTGSMAIPLVISKLLPGMGLRHSRIWAGREGKQSHRAMADVEDTIAVFKKLCELSWSGVTFRGLVDKMAQEMAKTSREITEGLGLRDVPVSEVRAMVDEQIAKTENVLAQADTLPATAPTE